MDDDRRTWLDSLKAGDAVAVDHHAGRYLGTVLERTRGGRIRVRWPMGNGLFYGTDVCPAGELVGGRSSREPARLISVGPELAAADDLAAIAEAHGRPATTAARLAQATPETLGRIAELAAALRAALDKALAERAEKEHRAWGAVVARFRRMSDQTDGGEDVHVQESR
jgi:hypothetical protein